MKNPLIFDSKEKEYVVIYCGPFDLQCPNCEKRFSQFDIKLGDSYRCPFCNVKLKGKGVDGIKLSE